MLSASSKAQKRCPQCGADYEPTAAFCAKDGTRLETTPGEVAAETDPYIGMVISGDIQILDVAGVGAMGRVYRAHQRGVDRNVAVKILHRELSGNAQLVARFNREAKIASRLQHPHVVEVYLAGQLPDHALYIVMEYLDGMSLAAGIEAAGGVLHTARALSIALQICDAVGEGHARGIVHRDLKPENVMLVRRAELGDWVKVLDFGIAKFHLGDPSMQTIAGHVFGTARYISPEGAQGTTVGPPGDVYSIATIVYQMLAGRTPFDAEPVGLLIKHIHEAPPPLLSWPRAADVPPALAKLVMDNLAKDPADRAANARVFGAQLAAVAKEAHLTISEVDVLARLSSAAEKRVRALDPTLDDAASVARAPSPPALTPSHNGQLGTSPAAESGVREPRNKPFAVILLALLLCAAVAGLAMQYAARRGDADHDAYINRTRAALADSRYVTPPGDCVRDLVVTGLKRWPNDVDLLQLRSTASMELVTRAMVAQNGGDVGGARDLARDATQLDPTDHSAALLLSEYDDDVKQFGGDAAVTTGRARVLFDPLPLTHVGRRVELTAHVTPGTAGPRTKITEPRMTLFDHSATVDGVSIPVVSQGQGLYRGTFSPTKAGNYDVVFEASIEGPKLRAVRELTVEP